MRIRFPSVRFGVLLLSLLLSRTVLSAAQEIRATVSISAEKLNTGDRDRIVRLSDQLQQYLNQTRWTDETFQLPVEVDVKLLLNSARNDDYEAQLILTSRRPIYGTLQSSPMTRFFDTKWRFKYNESQAFSHNKDVFDPLLSTLDYYIFIALAYDTDSYENLSPIANEYLETAREIANRGTGSGAYAVGWRGQNGDGRYEYANELLSAKLVPFRTSTFAYHFNGLDLLLSRPEQARENVARSLQVVAELTKRYPTNVVLRRFFEVKSGEITQTMREYNDRERVFQLLLTADPLHRNDYEAMR